MNPIYMHVTPTEFKRFRHKTHKHAQAVKYTVNVNTIPQGLIMPSMCEMTYM